MVKKQPRHLRLKSNRQSTDFYYKKVLHALEKLDLKSTADSEGLDDEITLLRVKIKSLLRNDPADFRQVALAVNLLARLLETRHNISQKSGIDIKEA